MRAHPSHRRRRDWGWRVIKVSGGRRARARAMISSRHTPNRTGHLVIHHVSLLYSVVYDARATPSIGRNIFDSCADIHHTHTGTLTLADESHICV